MQDQLPSSQLWWCLCKPNWAVRPIYVLDHTMTHPMVTWLIAQKIRLRLTISWLSCPFVKLGIISNQGYAALGLQL